MFGLPIQLLTATYSPCLVDVCCLCWRDTPLPFDSCCSVSLVSRTHADLAASRKPQLKYQSLEKPIAATVADAQAQLKTFGTKKIVIQWSNGKETFFKILVVPSLSCRILFGEDHLHITTLVDHAIQAGHSTWLDPARIQTEKSSI